jgi:phosphate uptake regulator
MASERRKIVALGRSSLVVSMPKAWLELHGLGKGDEVSLDVQPDGSLVIQSMLEQGGRRREIHLAVKTEEAEESIVRRIIGAFLDGCTVVKLSSGEVFSPGQQRAVREIAGRLYMMVQVSEARSIVLQTLVDESQASLASSVERMHVIAYSMCRDILEAFRKGDVGLARSVLSLEDDIDQLMFLLLRLIRRVAVDPVLGRKLGLSTLDCLEYQTLVFTIERIGDHATSMAESVIRVVESGIDVPGGVRIVLLKAAEIVFSSYDQAVQGYLSRNIEYTNEIIDGQGVIGDLYLDVTPLPMFGESGETSVLSDVINIRESLKKISHHAARIAELTIDRAYRTEVSK